MELVQIRSGRVLEPDLAEGRAVLEDALARKVRYLRLSLTDRCNYRCTYCMPERGIDQVARDNLLSFDEIEVLVRVFVNWGVERVRLTGGEPTVRKGIIGLISRLSKIVRPDGSPLQVVMTTNGELLEDLAEPLFCAGLSGLTVSIDSLRSDRFKAITRRGKVDRVVNGLNAATRAGFRGIKLNTVAIKGFNGDELAEICRFAWMRKMTPRFIEVMPMGAGEMFVPGELLPASEIRDLIAQHFSGLLIADQGDGVRGYGPASYWRMKGGEFSERKLGIIAAMTENFCSSCNRLRISATGQMHACLANDDAGDLRNAIRSGTLSELEKVVRRSMASKRDSHRFALDGSGGPQKTMTSIGG